MKRMIYLAITATTLFAACKKNDDFQTAKTQLTTSTDTLSVSMDSVKYRSIQNSAGVVTSLEFDILVTVSSPATIYLGQSAQFGSTTTGTNAFAYVLQSSTAPTTDITNPPAGMSVTTSFESTDAAVVGNGFVVNAGTSRHFLLKVLLNNSIGIVTTNFYRVALLKFKTFTDPGLTTGSVVTMLLPIEKYKTQFKRIG